jgi:hypothetical protein
VVIENLKDLERLLKLLRKQGVLEINLGSVSLKMGELPPARHENTTDQEIEIEDPLANFPDGQLTPEELTFFANGGLPEDNPYRDKQ